MNRTIVAMLLALIAESVYAQGALVHPKGHLNWIYPSGAQQGQTVEVEFGGADGLAGATAIHIEGPPGITVSEVKAVDGRHVTAKLTVAADAPLGRRMLRVLGGDNGLTNPRSFLVGRLTEVLEATDDRAVQDVPTPVVVNGRINPTVDVDRFRFVGRAGQSIVAAVMAQRIDVFKPHPAYDQCNLDVELELLNDRGIVIATGGDTLGLDPAVQCTLPADGNYTVLLKGLGYHGFPEAVYRLTLGEVPYPTAIFPAGGRRGETLDVEIAGFNIAPNTRVKVQVPTDADLPLIDVLFPGASEGNQFLTFLCSSDTEVLETSEPHLRDQAQPVVHPCTVNARFLTSAEEDWYLLDLKAQEGVLIEIVADRHLRSPVDSRVEVYDATGRKLAENDDGSPLQSECLHDYNSLDSWLPFTAPGDGKYFIRVVNQGSEVGPRAVYRLSIRPFGPDFELYHWPDAVPVWGAGSSATFVVQELHRGGFDGEIEIRVEGLPPGWTAPTRRVDCRRYASFNNAPNGGKTLMVITAPLDAARGTMVPFRVVGKAVVKGQTIEHPAQTLSLLGNIGDRMHLRFTRQAWAAVGTELGCRLETTTTEISGRAGETVQIPVKIHRVANFQAEMGLTVDTDTSGVACPMQPPVALTANQSEFLLPVRIRPEYTPGDYGMVISRSWSSDLRGGRPGPCTPLIMLHVLPPAAAVSK